MTNRFPSWWQTKHCNNDEGNLVQYAHTFASSLEPTKLATEDPALQAETKITVSKTPNNHTVKTENTDDPYPW